MGLLMKKKIVTYFGNHHLDLSLLLNVPLLLLRYLSASKVARLSWDEHLHACKTP